MIYVEVDKYNFIDAFKDYKRYKDYSYEGLCVLYDYLEELSNGNDIELDVIGLCVEFYELEPSQVIEEYGYLVEDEEFEDEDEMLEALLEEIRDQTSVLEVNRGESYIIQTF